MRLYMISNRIYKSCLIFGLIYFVPYLLFDWMGAAGIKDDTTPTIYKALQMLFPLMLVFLFFTINLIKGKVEVSVIDSFIFNIIFVIGFKMFILQDYEIYSIRLLFFLGLYLLSPKIDIDTIFSKYFLKNIIIFTCIILFFEVYILKYFDIVNPFVRSNDIRYVSNFGGPNILGAVGAYLFTLSYIWLRRYNHNKLKQYIYLALCLVMVVYSASMSAIAVTIVGFIIGEALNIDKKSILIGVIMLVIASLIATGVFNDIYIMYRFKKLILGESGSALQRLVFIEQLKNLNFFEHIIGSTKKFYFNESIQIQIYLNGGLISLISYCIFYFYKIIYFYKKSKYNKKYLYPVGLLMIVFIHSFVNPIVLLFPFIILLPFILKLK